jgi:hypothetical protein
MRTLITITLTLLLSGSAAAYESFEEGAPCSYWGRVNVISRPPGYYDEAHGPSVEVESDGRFADSTHQLMTPDEARYYAELLLEAADAAEAE